MNLKKILWAVLILCILITIPALLERIQVERENDMYEVTIPYFQIEEMISMGLDEDMVLRKLKDAGLHSVGFEPLSLRNLEAKNLIKSISKFEVLDAIGMENSHLLPQTTSLYLEILNRDNPLVRNIEEVFNFDLKAYGTEVQQIEFNDQLFYIIPSTTVRAMNKYIGFDFTPLNTLMAHGIEVLPRISNDFDFDVSHPLVVQFSEIITMTNANKVLFLQDITGYPKAPGEPSYLPEVAALLSEHQLSVVEIENFGQKGFTNIGYLLNHDVIRLRSFTLGKGNETSIKVLNEIIRAIDERNIRMVYLNTIARGVEMYESQREAEVGLYGTIEFLNTLESSSAFTPGSAMSFKELSQPFWLKLVVMAGVISLVTLFAQVIHPKLVIPALVGTGLVVALQIVTGHSALLKIISLGAAVVTPIFAVLAIKPFQSLKGLLLELVKAFSIALVGAWVVVGLLYGTEFLVKLNAFTGVKVLAGLPIIIAAAIFLRKYIMAILGEAVKYWHLIILGLLAVIFWFYIGRTGNQGIVLPFELQLRQWLESNAGVRPRTTEFLVGYPLFILGLYLTMVGKKWGRALYLFGALAFSSMVGTFTHLHTPLLTSLQRSITGLVFGMVIAGILIVLYNLALKKVYPMIKERIKI